MGKMPGMAVTAATRQPAKLEAAETAEIRQRRPATAVRVDKVE